MMFKKSSPKEVAVVQSLRDLGDESRDAGAWSDACGFYSDYLISNPDDFAINVQLGNCSKEAGDFDEAEKAYRRAIELNPKDADVRVQLGHLMKLVGHIEDALESYGFAATLDPNHRDASHERDMMLAARRNRHEIPTANAKDGLRRFGSLEALLKNLKENPEQSSIFGSYFNNFIPM